MQDSEKREAIGLIVIVVFTMLGGVATVFLVVPHLADLPMWAAVAILTSIALAIVGLGAGALIVLTRGSTESRRPTGEDVARAIALLDRLCNGLSPPLISDSERETSMELDPFSGAAAEATVRVLLAADAPLSKWWAEAVQREVPHWRDVIQVPAVVTDSALDVNEGCVMLVLIVLYAVYSAVQFLVGPALAPVVSVVIIVLPVVVIAVAWRRRSRRQSEMGLDELSCIGIRKVIRYAEKRMEEELTVYVIGRYDGLQYTEEFIETEDNMRLTRALLIPRARR